MYLCNSVPTIEYVNNFDDCNDADNTIGEGGYILFG